MNRDNHEMTRRTFVAGAAAGGFALAVGCGSDGATPGGAAGTGGAAGAGGTGGDAGPGDATAGNTAPVWTTVPTILFTQGVVSSFSIAEYVTDADGDALSIALNSVPLPAGVTFDAAGMRFVYDGAGPLANTSGHVLTADDGQS